MGGMVVAFQSASHSSSAAGSVWSRVRVRVRLRVRVRVGVGIRVRVRVGVGVEIRVRVRVGVGVGIRVRVRVGVGVRVSAPTWSRWARRQGYGASAALSSSKLCSSSERSWLGLGSGLGFRLELEQG